MTKAAAAAAAAAAALRSLWGDGGLVFFLRRLPRSFEHAVVFHKNGNLLVITQISNMGSVEFIRGVT